MQLDVIWHFRIQFVLSNHFETFFNSIVELMYWKWTENVLNSHIFSYEKWQNVWKLKNFYWKNLHKSPLERWTKAYIYVYIYAWNLDCCLCSVPKPKFCIRNYSIQLKFATSKFEICRNSFCTNHQVEWNWFGDNSKFGKYVNWQIDVYLL